MKGPQGKGHAEMAVTKPKGSGVETPTSEPGFCATDMWDSDWDEDPEDFYVYRNQRRLSDPSANLNNFVRGGWKTKIDAAAGKSRSEQEGLDCLENGVSEIEAGDLRDGKFSWISSFITDVVKSNPLLRWSLVFSFTLDTFKIHFIYVALHEFHLHSNVHLIEHHLVKSSPFKHLNESFFLRYLCNNYNFVYDNVSGQN